MGHSRKEAQHLSRRHGAAAAGDVGVALGRHVALFGDLRRHQPHVADLLRHHRHMSQRQRQRLLDVEIGSPNGSENATCTSVARRERARDFHLPPLTVACFDEPSRIVAPRGIRGNSNATGFWG